MDTASAYGAEDSGFESPWGFYLNIYYNMAMYKRKTRRKVGKGKKMKRSMGTRRKHKKSKGRRTRRGGIKNAPRPNPILQPTAAQRAHVAGPQGYDNPVMPGSELHGLQTATLSRQQQREHKDVMDKRLRALMQQQQMPPSPT